MDFLNASTHMKYMYVILTLIQQRYISVHVYITFYKCNFYWDSSKTEPE